MSLIVLMIGTDRVYMKQWSNKLLVLQRYDMSGCYLLVGCGGKVLPQTSHLPPQKFEIKKITQSAMRTYTELDQLSDQTLNDIINKYKYMLLNTHHAWYVARPFPPPPK